MCRLSPAGTTLKSFAERKARVREFDNFAKRPTVGRKRAFVHIQRPIFGEMMFVAEKFVFLHLPKTAGVYVESVCQDVLKMKILHSRRHAKCSELPSEFSHLPKIGVWRDPWDWYASLFEFAKIARNGATSELVALASDEFNLGFEDTLERLLVPDEAFMAAYEEKMKAWGGRALDFECLGANSLREAKERGLGLMGFLAEEIFPCQLDVEWRFETLKKQMLQHISPMCEDRGKFRAAAVAQPRNSSNKPGLEMMYSPRGRDLVASREAPLIARLGYAPPRLRGVGASI